MSLPWRDFSAFLGEHFAGKMQKLTVNAGLGCPNRDGTIGRGGCAYCDNRSFSPEYTAHVAPIAEQIARGREFFARKYPQMRYLAYFQSYTNSYGATDTLLDLYGQALACDCVDGLIIGTRPDCMADSLLDGLRELARRQFVMIEYGAESSHDSTLEAINRGHTWACTADTVRRTADAGIAVGLHLIMGLPGETRAMMLETIDRVNELPITTLKLHQLQIIKGTRLAEQYERGELEMERFTAESYAEFCCEVVGRLRRDIAIERFLSQSPPEMVVTPKWGLKNYQFTAMLSRLVEQSLGRVDGE